MKFVCKNCNYKFESESDCLGKKCAYCGEKTLVKEPNAEELIMESDEF